MSHQESSFSDQTEVGGNQREHTAPSDVGQTHETVQPPSFSSLYSVPTPRWKDQPFDMGNNRTKLMQMNFLQKVTQATKKYLSSSNRRQDYDIVSLDILTLSHKRLVRAEAIFFSPLPLQLLDKNIILIGCMMSINVMVNVKPCDYKRIMMYIPTFLFLVPYSLVETCL